MISHLDPWAMGLIFRMALAISTAGLLWALVYWATAT